ncbi:hypothetical protein ACLB2K_066425 [Fragaria x ananassa]
MSKTYKSLQRLMWGARTSPVASSRSLACEPVRQLALMYPSSGRVLMRRRVAASRFCVVIPDFFHGDPFCVVINNRPLAVWLKDHGTDKGFEDAKSVIDTLIRIGFSAIGAAGFCWGAKVVTELAKSEFIQAAVLLHPSFTTVDDIEGVKSPIAILGAEIDNYSPPELVKKFEDILKAKPKVNSYVKIFPKVAHGWVVRYDADDEAAA